MCTIVLEKKERNMIKEFLLSILEGVCIPPLPKNPEQVLEFENSRFDSEFIEEEEINDIKKLYRKIKESEE